MSALAPTLQAFFTTRLNQQRQASSRTVHSYRDAFRLLLIYANTRTGIAPSRLDLADLDAELISGFLDHLETRTAQQHPHPQRPSHRDPFLLPLCRLPSPRTRRADQPDPRHPIQTM